MTLAAYVLAIVLAVGLVIVAIPLWAISGHMVDVTAALRVIGNTLTAQNEHYDIPTTPAALRAGVVGDKDDAPPDPFA